jgi:hypothetical protein
LKKVKKKIYDFNPTIHEIDMDEDLIKKLYNNLLKDEKINKERHILVNEILKFESDDEKIEKLYEEGLTLFEFAKYNDAIEKFKYC